MFVEQLNETGIELSEDVVEQLKDMEKRHICRFTTNYIKNQCYPSKDYTGYTYIIKSVLPIEQYYNETYGGKKK